MEVRAEVCKAGVKACAALVGQALFAEAKALLNARRPAGLLSEILVPVFFVLMKERALRRGTLQQEGRGPEV
jgi:hypothetical protein